MTGDRLSVDDTRDAITTFLTKGYARLSKSKGQYPEIWAYFASYDWVVMAQLWGRMVDLPSWMPKHPMDLQQWWVQLGRPLGLKPLKPEKAHDALEDARWNRDFYLSLQHYEDQKIHDARADAFGAGQQSISRVDE